MVAPDSTFDKYHKEVTSGRLDWTPAHTNEQFWRDNINKFEADDFELIRYAHEHLNGWQGGAVIEIWLFLTPWDGFDGAD